MRYNGAVHQEPTRWDWHDLYNAPTLLSLTRAPLAVAFVLLRDQPLAELAVLAAAGLSDVLDGWVARRTGKVSPVGAFVDGLVDKIFVFGVALAVLLSGRVVWWQMLLLGVRDLGEGALLAWTALRAPALLRELKPHAERAGKGTTVLQFAAVVAAILDGPVAPFAVGAAALGAVTAAGYAGELRAATARREARLTSGS